jgi:hypothetical protein
MEDMEAGRPEHKRWESGRVGEWESGRVGEWIQSRVWIMNEP